MPPMPALKTTGQLYPPAASDEVADLVAEVRTGERDREGRAVLRRMLTAVERETVGRRAAVVDRWLDTGMIAEKTDAVLGMMIGKKPFLTSTDDAKEIALQYAHVCRDLPEWAVVRACGRFSRGEVKPDEIGEKTIDFGWRPSDAHLHMVAHAIARFMFEERVRLDDAMRGAPALPGPRREAPKPGLRPMDDWRDKRRLEAEGEQVERQLRQEADAGRLRAESIERAADTYRRAGLEPPVVLPGQIPVTLQMRLRHGYTIEADEAGKPVLVSPPVVKSGARA